MEVDGEAQTSEEQVSEQNAASGSQDMEVEPCAEEVSASVGVEQLGHVFVAMNLTVNDSLL